MRSHSPLWLLRVTIIVFVLCTTNCCIAFPLISTRNRPVDAGMEIFVQASIERHMMDKICIFPFSSPPETAAASGSLTDAFQSRLVQRRPFREVRILPYEVKSESEALWYTRNEGYELAMIPSLLYMMDGTGSMPTRLVIRTRILDARTGNVLWDLKQSARSDPGCDVDLFWTTITGAPAQRCRVMADGLAQLLAEYLVRPLEEKKEKAVGLPVSVQ